jgi:hypothetical protein
MTTIAIPEERLAEHRRVVTDALAAAELEPVALVPCTTSKSQWPYFSVLDAAGDHWFVGVSRHNETTAIVILRDRSGEGADVLVEPVEGRLL